MLRAHPHLLHRSLFPILPCSLPLLICGRSCSPGALRYALPPPAATRCSGYTRAFGWVHHHYATPRLLPHRFHTPHLPLFYPFGLLGFTPTCHYARHAPHTALHTARYAACPVFRVYGYTRTARSTHHRGPLTTRLPRRTPLHLRGLPHDYYHTTLHVWWLMRWLRVRSFHTVGLLPRSFTTDLWSTVAFYRCSPRFRVDSLLVHYIYLYTCYHHLSTGPHVCHYAPYVFALRCSRLDGLLRLVTFYT